jgi:hypothetical protein
MNSDPMIEIGPGYSVPASRLARTLWPGARGSELAALEMLSPDEMLRHYRAHFDPPPYVLDLSNAERAEIRRRTAARTP